MRHVYGNRPTMEGPLYSMRDLFTSQARSEAGGATFVGSPTVNNGVVIESGKYVRYDDCNGVIMGQGITLLFRFIVGFELGDGENHYLTDSTDNGNGAQRNAILKETDGDISWYLDGAYRVRDIPPAQFPGWTIGEERSLIFTASRSVTGACYYQGAAVTVADTNPLGTSPQNNTPGGGIIMSPVYLGVATDGTYPWLGTITEFAALHRAVSADDAARLHAGTLVPFTGRATALQQSLDDAYE